jgi:hypothetical protein
MIYALQGDDKMSPEELAFVRDVTRRQVNEETRRLLAFCDLLFPATDEGDDALLPDDADG